MNRHSVGNIVLFVVLAVAVLGGWWLVETYLIPKPPPPETAPAETKKPTEPTASPKLVADAAPLLALTGGGVSGKPGELAKWVGQLKAAEPPKPVEPSVPHRLIGLSGPGYNLQVLLTNKGGGVQQVTLPAFDQTTRQGTTDIDTSTGQPYPLELVPGHYRPVNRSKVTEEAPHLSLTAGPVDPATPLAPPSYTLLHYDTPPEGNNSHPSAELATRKWEVVGERAGTDETPGEVAFETTLGAPHHVRVRKTFTLAKTDFHVRMRVEFTPTADREAGAPKLAYQIAGPRNVPIEGEWYSAVQRNAIFGYKSGGSAGRAIVDANRIVTEHGSMKYTANDSELRGDPTFAAVVNQFFAAAVCIDPDQPDEVRKNLWGYVRATREWNETDRPFDPADAREAYFADKPQLGDITVRAVSKPLELKADKVEHSYWLYHGPTKVRLLNSLHLLDEAHKKYATDPALVNDKYIGAIGLNVITDAPSPGPFGDFLRMIGWNFLVVMFTNLMHDILGWMHGLVPVWGVNILMLTVLVRLLLLIPSRRQQAGMIKMQEKMAAMKPELDKVAERYKSDPQRLNQEKTRLMLQHGVNPLSSMGGCLLMFAQMPVFLGLYYCLQESVFFRLDSFLWVKNLAAPDMLFPWSESIPFVSDPGNMGSKGSWVSFLYLGPYFNLLPIVAVALMYINFKISSPPPTDEQQEMQQKTMKFMMIFMGVFFYKMAAGLCLYFTCSTLWGMTERWLLKRKKKKAEEAAAADPLAAAKPAAPPKPPGFFERVKQGLMEKLEEAQRQAESQGQQIINNPKPKPPQGGGPTGGSPKLPPGGAPGLNGHQGGKGKRKRRKK